MKIRFLLLICAIALISAVTVVSFAEDLPNILPASTDPASMFTEEHNILQKKIEEFGTYSNSVFSNFNEWSFSWGETGDGSSFQDTFLQMKDSMLNKNNQEIQDILSGNDSTIDFSAFEESKKNIQTASENIQAEYTQSESFVNSVSTDVNENLAQLNEMMNAKKNEMKDFMESFYARIEEIKRDMAQQLASFKTSLFTQGETD